MSVELGLYKGAMFDGYTSEFVSVIPVSFQRVWNDVWEKAISACMIRKFVCCGLFTVNEISTVLAELDAIYNWVHYNGGEDTSYIQERIEELKDYLNTFYLEHKNEDYWFDLG